MQLMPWVLRQGLLHSFLQLVASTEQFAQVLSIVDGVIVLVDADMLAPTERPSLLVRVFNWLLIQVQIDHFSLLITGEDGRWVVDLLPRFGTILYLPGLV